MISDKYQTIFIHIPKCGGTSIESLVWLESEKTEENLWMGFIDKYHNKYQAGGLQHLKAIQIRSHVGRDKFTRYFKFSIIRNPYARSVSQFLSMNSRQDLREYIGMERDDGFLTYLSKIQSRSHVQWEQQVSFLYDYKGKCLADLVVKLEEIEVLPSLLQGKGQLPLFDIVPKINANHTKYTFRDYICDKARQIIIDMYLEDFEAFDYATDL